ncbi:MAG TPA: glycerol-3-phosphate acyltransferase [Acidimicrobiia bacterium]|nr:glycerol-3-phosphate acyltransferase [Acidimicrobiia bacterium]
MSAAGILLLSFLLGSVPVMNIAAHRVRGVDLRDVGGGTVSGTSLYRIAGFVPLAVAGCFDVAKGAVGPLLAGDHAVVAALAGGLAVAGHNWSPFLRGAGGRGIAPALGALLVNAWPGAVILVLGMLGGKLFHETAVGALAAELALAPVLGLVMGADAALAGAAIAVPMVVKRVLGNSRPAGNRRRVYLHRLLYDTDTGMDGP